MITVQRLMDLLVTLKPEDIVYIAINQYDKVNDRTNTNVFPLAHYEYTSVEKLEEKSGEFQIDIDSSNSLELDAYSEVIQNNLLLLSPFIDENKIDLQINVI